MALNIKSNWLVNDEGFFFIFSQTLKEKSENFENDGKWTLRQTKEEGFW